MTRAMREREDPSLIACMGAIRLKGKEEEGSGRGGGRRNHRKEESKADLSRVYHMGHGSLINVCQAVLPSVVYKFSRFLLITRIK